MHQVIFAALLSCAAAGAPAPAALDSLLDPRVTSLLVDHVVSPGMGNDEELADDNSAGSGSPVGYFLRTFNQSRSNSTPTSIPVADGAPLPSWMAGLTHFRLLPGSFPKVNEALHMNGQCGWGCGGVGVGQRAADNTCVDTAFCVAILLCLRLYSTDPVPVLSVVLSQNTRSPNSLRPLLCSLPLSSCSLSLSLSLSLSIPHTHTHTGDGLPLRRPRIRPQVRSRAGRQKRQLPGQAIPE